MIRRADKPETFWEALAALIAVLIAILYFALLAYVISPQSAYGQGAERPLDALLAAELERVQREGPVTPRIQQHYELRRQVPPSIYWPPSGFVPHQWTPPHPTPYPGFEQQNDVYRETFGRD